ncbi:hypothetical protein ACFY8B_23535 [Streptomyces sp. NPDC012751]|uniref:hypothetical protein n=1 Tax=Streptomyces sp. NPDC012751 TaxID=3364846 RepID=UPI0036C7CD03
MVPKAGSRRDRLEGSDEPAVSEAGSGTDRGDAAGCVHDLPAPVTAEARQTLPLAVAAIGRLGAVSADFGPQRGRHPTWAAPTSLSRRRTAARRRTVLVGRRTHRRAFPADAATSALFDELSIDPSDGKVHLEGAAPDARSDRDVTGDGRVHQARTGQE